MISFDGILAVLIREQKDVELVAPAIALSVVRDSPLIGVVGPGVRIPEKMMRVIDSIVEYDPDFDRLSMSIKQAAEEMGLLQCNCHQCRSRRAAFDQMGKSK